MVKGKLSDRAIHLKIVPKGTVQFETIMVRNVQVLVESEPRMGVEEIPGNGRLMEPLPVQYVTGKPDDSISHVDIWQRCMPDDLLCRVGDILLVDIHFYRPEKLFFARSVRIELPFPLGRDKGVICSIRDALGFGFISSEQRELDIYFKLSQVMAADGSIVKKSDLSVGMRVSFDVGLDNGDSKLRANRVMLIDPDQESANNLKKVIKQNIIGKVVRSANKKVAVGMIQIAPELWKEINDQEYFDPEMVSALTNFRDNDSLAEIELLYLNYRQKKQYSSILDQLFPTMQYEALPVDIPELAQARFTSLKIVKNIQDQQSSTKGLTAAEPASIKSSKKSKSKEGFTIPYLKDDYISEALGPLVNDLEVSFDIAWNPNYGKMMARSIKITDEPVTDVFGDQLGIIDVLVEKGEKYGFIRCIPSYEKLFWHVSSASNSQDMNNGGEVIFQIRRRGGMRCATNIRSLPIGTLRKDQILPGQCIALIINETQAVLIDVANCAELSNRFINLQHLLTSIRDKDKDLTKQWEKVARLPESSQLETNESSVAMPDISTTDIQVSSVEPDQSCESPDNELDAVEGPLSESSIGFGRVEYKAKYFPHFSRNPVPFESVNPSISLYPGDVVSCACAVNWGDFKAVQRVVVTEVITPAANTLKRRGCISRSKFRMKNAVNISEHYNISTLDFAEIFEEKTKEQKLEALANYVGGEADPTLTGYYYCESVEIIPSNEFSRDSIQSGDEVEFYCVPSYGNIALGAKLLPKANNRDYPGVTKVISLLYRCA